jgi:hypothetical protein
MLRLYRAMCSVEAEKTLKFQSLQFNRNREKCFSHSINWILQNPCNGRFNNSAFCPDRYAHILIFDFTEESKKAFVIASNEWKIHIKKTNLIKLMNVKKYPDNPLFKNAFIRDELKGSYKALTKDEREDSDDQPYTVKTND